MKLYNNHGSRAYNAVITTVSGCNSHAFACGIRLIVVGIINYRIGSIGIGTEYRQATSQSDYYSRV